MTSDEYKAERQRRGTQASVAALLCVDRTTVAKRETGLLPISREAWLALNAIPATKRRKQNKSGQ